MRILGIGDPHAPVGHPGYLRFCQHLFEKYNCDHVLCIGDIIDHHGISFHAAHPSAPGPRDEYEQTLFHIAKWQNAFPTMDVCIGNHDARVFRLAEAAGIGQQYIRDYAEVWDTPGWTWADDFEYDGVYWTHGNGCGGEHPAFNLMKKTAMSCVIGHVHTAAGIKWMANRNTRLFGMDLGCGIDEESAAMAYGKHFVKRPVLSAGVVIDGVPYHEIMPCGPGEPYHRSKFQKRGKRSVFA